MEAEIVNSFLPDLVTAVSDIVQSVSDQCLAKGLIPSDVHDQVLESGGTSKEKARTLILAVKKSTETDSRCLEILLNILDQKLPYAIRDSLLSKIRKELTEQANTCTELVPLSEAVQQVPQKELSKESTLQQSFLLGKFEDSIRQHEHACAEKKLLEERLKVKSEKCKRLKGELETLKGQNQQLASNTQSRIEACINQIESLKKRIEELQNTIEEHGMQAKRGRSTIITETKKVFTYLTMQSQQKYKQQLEDTIRVKDREHKLAINEKDLQIQELESKLGSTSTQSQSLVTTIPSDMLQEKNLDRLASTIIINDPEGTCRVQWRDVGTQLGFPVPELDDIYSKIHNNVNILGDLDKIHIGNICTKEMLSRWLKWYPKDSRGSTSFPTYSSLKLALVNAGFGNVIRNLMKYEDITKSTDTTPEKSPLYGNDYEPGSTPDYFNDEDEW